MLKTNDVSTLHYPGGALSCIWYTSFSSTKSVIFACILLVPVRVSILKHLKGVVRDIYMIMWLVKTFSNQVFHPLLSTFLKFHIADIVLYTIMWKMKKIFRAILENGPKNTIFQHLMSYNPGSRLQRHLTGLSINF